MSGKIILASNSPRRRELLGLVFPDFVIAEPREVEEVYPSTMAPECVPVFLSQLKSQAYLHDLPAEAVLITADTVVILDGKILGKPHSRDEAVAMLKALMGKTHIVVTGVTLSAAGGSKSFSECTKVTFSSLSDEEIERYVDCYKPYDKAGAYGVQEWIGCVGIKHLEGCFYNVMGLPLHTLYENLRDFQ